jgi:hypothetical protein
LCKGPEVRKVVKAVEGLLSFIPKDHGEPSGLESVSDTITFAF